MTIFDLSVWQLTLIAGAAFMTQTIGGLAGYGTGLLMPLVLVPLLGAEAIVPVISLSAVLTNLTRVAVFRAYLDVRKAVIVTACALPTTFLGAWCFTTLSSRGAALVIGLGLIAIVPLRRILVRHRFRLGTAGAAGAGVVYGFLTGGMTGVGVILLSIFLSMGLTGQQVIATDALTSFVLGVAKSGVFAAAGALPPKLWLVAILIGAMATPGTLVAKYLAHKFSARLQDSIIEVAIIIGGLLLLWRAVS